MIPASACGATSAGSTPGGSLTSERSSTSDVVREAAVAGQSGELVPLAVHVEPAAAGHAQPAAVGRVEQDGVAGVGGGDAVADSMHPPCVLVAEHERKPDAGRLHQPVLGVQVGRAHAGAADAHDDVSWPAGLRLGAVDELERPAELGEDRGPHAARWSASLVASAMIVSEGFTDSVRGISAASPT